MKGEKLCKSTNKFPYKWSCIGFDPVDVYEEVYSRNCVWCKKDNIKQKPYTKRIYIKSGESLK